MNIISSKLDKIADSLENKGLYKEAEDIDVIANTIESEMTYGRSPKQIIEDDALDFAQNVAEENRELLRVPDGKRNPDYNRILQSTKNLLSMMYMRKGLRRADTDALVAALDLTFEGAVGIDKDLLSFIGGHLKINWTPKVKSI
jgi:hypothetical protein